mmetsp:Transcript_25156/g.70628  ORF Transcript_25156/g.70628 Transcript_25156/m.70628 type:complete len:227 (+) Transcript_25156:441-1121(+)
MAETASREKRRSRKSPPPPPQASRRRPPRSSCQEGQGAAPSSARPVFPSLLYNPTATSPLTKFRAQICCGDFDVKLGRRTPICPKGSWLTAIMFGFRSSSRDAAGTFLRSLPIIIGEALMDHSASCVFSSSREMQFAPASSMSMSCQCPGPAKGANTAPKSPQWSMMPDKEPQLQSMSAQFRQELHPLMMNFEKGFVDSSSPMYAGQLQLYSIWRPEASKAAPIAL